MTQTDPGCQDIDKKKKSNYATKSLIDVIKLLLITHYHVDFYHKRRSQKSHERETKVHSTYKISWTYQQEKKTKY